MPVQRPPLTRTEQIALLLALALAAALMWPVRGYLTDDTFIHLQYARNLATGHGFVFNPGERVYGSTSPLWVALLADAMMLGVDGILAARVIGAVATLASVLLFFQLMRHTGALLGWFALLTRRFEWAPQRPVVPVPVMSSAAAGNVTGNSGSRGDV